MELSPTMERFVLHWGEMGTRWGVSRSVAQVHGLLYLSPKPLTADEIVSTLSIARSNVSASIKELQSWHLIQTHHVMGDRRDHFSAISDPWEAFMLIVEGRKQREIDPTLTTLRQCVEASPDDKGLSKESAKRIEETLEFLELLTSWYEDVRRVPRPLQLKILKLGGKVAKLLGKA
jgi:DNA-binding transcriptional regulator GbsR (MarR family)